MHTDQVQVSDTSYCFELILTAVQCVSIATGAAAKRIITLNATGLLVLLEGS